MIDKVGFIDKNYAERRVSMFPGFACSLSHQLIDELMKVDRSNYSYGDFVIGYYPGVFRICKIYRSNDVLDKKDEYFVELFPYMDEYGNVIPMEKGKVHKENFTWCVKIDESIFDVRMKAVLERMNSIRNTLFTAKHASEFGGNHAN